MLWAQITLLILNLIGILAAGCLHGKPKDGTWNFPVSFILTIVTLILYYCAGALSQIVK